MGGLFEMLNVVGCSHYLSEKWAMESLVSYLSEVCKAEFIENSSNKVTNSLEFSKGQFLEMIKRIVYIEDNEARNLLE